MTKKILISILILITILILAFGIYIFFFSSDNQSGGGVKAFDDLFSFDSVGGSGDVGFGGENTDNINGDGFTDSVDDNINQNNNGFGLQKPELNKLSSNEISGFKIFGTSTASVIRYVDTESGNIYETDLNSLNTIRITNTTILQTIDSLWLDKNNVVLRYIDEAGDIQSFSAEIITMTENTEPEVDEGGENLQDLNGSFLDRNIEVIDVLNNKIFALLENGSGSTGIIYNPDLSSENTILVTPLREILASFIDDNTVAINTKPSNNSLGYLFLLDIKSEKLNPILSDISGLSAIVSENKDVLYSSSLNKGVSLWYMENQSGDVREINKATLAEKCVWDNSSENIVYCAVPKNISSIRGLPDEWYKGNVSFSDDIWKINLLTDEMELMFVPEEYSGETVDVLNISISQNGQYIAFVNKIDRVLWVINLQK